MKKHLLATTALAALMAAGSVAAVAQTGSSPDAQKPEAAQPDSAQPEQQQMKPEAKDSAQDQATKPGSGSVEFIAAQKDTDWLAESLIGRRVQNASGEDLGGVTDLLLDENGNVIGVLVGVGGFLGIGGKDVAVRFSDLEFKDRAEQQKMAGNDARESVAKENTRLPSSGSGSGGDPTRMASEGSASREAQSGGTAERKDPDHRDKVIVLNATKEQLENAPAFKRLGDTEAPARSEQGGEPAKGQNSGTTGKPKQQ